MRKVIAIILVLSNPSWGITKFMESGGDATSDISFWPTAFGTIAVDSTVSFTGPSSIKLTSENAAAIKTGVLANAGRAITFRFRFDTIPASANAQFTSLTTDALAGDTHNLYITTAGTIFSEPVGATSVTGTKVLSVNTWYRIAIVYTVTNTTTFRFDVYVDGILDSSATAGTLTTANAQAFALVSSSNFGTGKFVWFDDIYINDNATYTDPGDVRVTAKRPNANGTTNGFSTQIGAGGSGYGTGHAPQVNERPLSTTNGWSIVGAGSAVTEQYNVEAPGTGDVNTANFAIVDVGGWVFAKAAISETAQLILNGVNNAISLTSTNTAFLAYANSTSFPAGTGSDIGLTTDTTVTTVSLYEAGVMVAYRSAVACQPPFCGFLK